MIEQNKVFLLKQKIRLLNDNQLQSLYEQYNEDLIKLSRQIRLNHILESDTEDLYLQKSVLEHLIKLVTNEMKRRAREVLAQEAKASISHLRSRKEEQRITTQKPAEFKPSYTILDIDLPSVHVKMK